MDRTVSIVAGSDLDSTTAHRPQPEQIVLARPPAPASTELGEVLRRRLRVIAGVIAVAVVAAMCVMVLPHHELLLTSPATWTHTHSYFASLLLLFLPQTWAFAALARSKCGTIHRLRLVEFVIFSTTCAYLTWESARMLVDDRHLLEEFWPLYGRTVASAFGILVVIYSVLIPNLWQRCAAGVGLIYGGAYLASAIGFLIAPQPAGTVVSFLVMLTLWLGMTGAVVVFGAYRVEALRKAAELGRELGQYVLREKLGAGGMGEVYRAEHAFLRRPSPIKLIRRGEGRRPGHTGAVRAGGTGHRGPHPPEHRPGLRLWPRRRWHLLLRHGVLARSNP